MQKDVINVQIVRLCHNVYVKKKTHNNNNKKQHNCSNVSDIRESCY